MPGLDLLRVRDPRRLLAIGPAVSTKSICPLGAKLPLDPSLDGCSRPSLGPSPSPIRCTFDDPTFWVGLSVDARSETVSAAASLRLGSEEAPFTKKGSERPLPVRGEELPG